MTAIVPSGGLVEPAADIQAIAAHMANFQKLKANLIVKGVDTVSIQGKEYVKRSGWRKFALAFNISDEIVKEEREDIPNGVIWTIHVKATAPNGRSCIGIAKCASTEKTFSHKEHDTYATAHTRAKNRAISDLIGSGEVSAEEMQAAAQPPASDDRKAEIEKAWGKDRLAAADKRV